MDKYAVKFAPDGKRYQIIKKGKVEKIWDYFNFNFVIKEILSLNPQAKFKMVNIGTGFVIGTLPKEA